MDYKESLEQFRNWEKHGYRHGTDMPSGFAIELAIEALKKQIPEKPEVGSEYVGVCKEAWYKDFRCPRCNRKVYEEDFEGYFMALYPACECGKLIDWSEVE